MSWTRLLEQLYEHSWNEPLGRFRAPFAFRGLPDIEHPLTNSLTRLAGDHRDVEKIELAMLRNFRKFASTAFMPPLLDERMLTDGSSSEPQPASASGGW